METANVIPFPQKPRSKPGVEAYFGVCPECGGQDGFFNVGSNHWFFCNDHQTAWCFGSNIFSGWREQTAGEHEQNGHRLATMTIVDMWVPPEASDGAA